MKMQHICKILKQYHVAPCNELYFCDCRYYSLDAYYSHKMEKEMKKVVEKERTVFNDEEVRRYASLLTLLRSLF